jgi:hypothetical protein
MRPGHDALGDHPSGKRRMGHKCGVPLHKACPVLNVPVISFGPVKPKAEDEPHLFLCTVSRSCKASNYPNGIYIAWAVSLDAS